MPTDVNEMIAKLSPTRRKAVKARAAELIAEELKARELPQSEASGKARRRVEHGAQEKG